ncbi:AroM family protein [Desulfosporosinus metallidurans]|uniref:AroM protein n=1 Tax=Desulfosporosinus metallidurans TaxID=1888891 RepID=A0A1Q8QXB8_9FIRM|nr:AroM family protein [Desulfosporosinus metallidurans]OLN31979.1 AroM protein [Desulfosporosinus metallidurans]
MKRKIGTITIGQSPREDVIGEMRDILGDNIEILQAGALDGLTNDEILQFVPKEGDFVLVSKLKDGLSVKFGESYILPRLQKCVEKLDAEGAELIVFICTGKFPTIFNTQKLLLYPQTILHAVVPRLAPHSHIGVLNPDRDQVRQCLELWGQSVEKVEAVVGSPYGDIAEVIQAAEELRKQDVDVIVMDCIGYTVEMKRIVQNITGKPVILARTLVARIVREMMD